MTATILAVFVLVYLGMILGGLPFLQLDRTGIALLGAIALMALEAVSLEEAWAAVHVPTLILLFAFMVISAQLRLGGFYTFVTRRLTALPLSPPALLALLIAAVAGLSAVFSNDIVCLAMAPVLIEACRERRLDPVPYLLALACGANIGSAATLIGNPQNMLIGERLEMSFAGYLREAAVPVTMGLVITWAVIVLGTRGRWSQPLPAPFPTERREEAGVPFDRWQVVKGLSVAVFLFAAFVLTAWPRELLALGGAGLLLMSRRLHSRHMLGLVDWQLLVLFIGLFVVNHALEKTGLPAWLVAELAQEGLDLRSPMPLFLTTFVLSNLVSNVPAVMLLLPVASHPMAGTLLALASTLAGNLLIVGSIANIIVVEAAARYGVRIDWRRHARVGVPVTLATLTVAGIYLAWRAGAAG
ncbi:MAG: anion transporter [Azospira oryzae]|uniref:Anion transporter n=1 Tax=Pelomicrobium methylotrophicum TaxID=2602750 RepID=A0A5C7EIF6_9PROT|nr:anion transporter [Pelomicrobium methylotrophicum]PZP58514.1 MAG: anion transporter [Azospira oryzae]PZP79839.1 MAG: anion transporter [Azospira oryzae]TXF10654.1 anion transporter [Pelomicrobium methylotrophicum]